VEFILPYLSLNKPSLDSSGNQSNNHWESETHMESYVMVEERDYDCRDHDYGNRISVQPMLLKQLFLTLLFVPFGLVDYVLAEQSYRQPAQP
jgi:hypothetical protein